MTPTCGAWWCRDHGHWRSGPRHLSPRSRVCTQKWHSEDIHSHIYSHPAIHTHPKQNKKEKNKIKWRKNTHLNSPNMMPSFNCPLPIQCSGGRLSASLAPAPQDFSTSEAFSPRTVLTENICRCVQRQHFPTTIPFLTTPTITLSCLASGWLLVTRTHGACRCRYRGHCRSGPRHLSPRSRVCAQEWHSEDIHSHIHTHPAMHTAQQKKYLNKWAETKMMKNTPQLTKHDAFV